MQFFKNKNNHKDPQWPLLHSRSVVYPFEWILDNWHATHRKAKKWHKVTQIYGTHFLTWITFGLAPEWWYSRYCFWVINVTVSITYFHTSSLSFYNVFSLTRAPLGYFYNAPHWGGGAISSPPLISETTGPILKIQAAFESPGKTVEGKQILLTSGSRVTSQVRSKSKCSTFRAWWHRRAKLRC